MKILEMHFFLNFTILQLFLKFDYNLAHRSINQRQVKYRQSFAPSHHEN
jgi:hypothetical protein